MQSSPLDLLLWHSNNSPPWVFHTQNLRDSVQLGVPTGTDHSFLHRAPCHQVPALEPALTMDCNCEPKQTSPFSRGRCVFCPSEKKVPKTEGRRKNVDSSALGHCAVKGDSTKLARSPQAKVDLRGPGVLPQDSCCTVIGWKQPWEQWPPSSGFQSTSAGTFAQVHFPQLEECELNLGQ